MRRLFLITFYRTRLSRKCKSNGVVFAVSAKSSWKKFRWFQFWTVLNSRFKELLAASGQESVVLTTLVPEAFLYSLLANFATQTVSSLLIVFIGTKRWEPKKESLWSRPLGTSLSCHQLVTVVSDWRIFLIALRVIWLDGLNISGNGSGVSIFTFMGRCK